MVVATNVRMFSISPTNQNKPFQSKTLGRAACNAGNRRPTRASGLKIGCLVSDSTKFVALVKIIYECWKSYPIEIFCSFWFGLRQFRKDTSTSRYKQSAETKLHVWSKFIELLLRLEIHVCERARMSMQLLLFCFAKREARCDLVFNAGLNFSSEF